VFVKGVMRSAKRRLGYCGEEKKGQTAETSGQT